MFHYDLKYDPGWYELVSQKQPPEVFFKKRGS